MTDEIKAVARRRLAAEGANLSLRAVAREVGMVSSALYRYFPSRDDLLTALIIDAYNSMGEAGEAADAAVADRADLLGRWLAVTRGLRAWALERPHEYALLYGSPVPGYAAPQDTIGPASRPVVVLGAILSDAQAAGLLVSLDCGITAALEVRAAAALGLDTVVVDHHTVPVDLPAAVAILNPHQPGCGYPSKDLAAVGVTFALAMALRKALRTRGRFGAERPEPNLKDALDLVALGTVADVVPLVGANRILVRWGLEVLARSRRPGVRALKRVAGIADGADVTAGQVGFRLAPRINAAGRLDDAGRGVRLLLETDAERADALARELDRENLARQEIERTILDEALHDAAERVRSGARGLVLARDGWHAGVVGIVASRIVERFHRPAVLVALGETDGKGSGRSIESFHLHDALQACAAHLVRLGGHRHAAGVTIARDRVGGFREAFEAHALAHVREEDLVPRCRIEGWVEERDVSERAAVDLARLGPYGAGHPEPVFALRGAAARARTMGASGAHLKLALGRLDAIGFGMGDRLGLCGGAVEATFTVGLDEWDGVRRLQLKLRDVRAA